MGKAETLLQVKDAEAKAKQTLEQAEERQRSIVAAARKEAVERSQKAEHDVRAKTESALAQERQSLSVQREALLTKGRDEAAKIEAKARDRIPKAKLMIKQSFERTLDVAAGANE